METKITLINQFILIFKELIIYKLLNIINIKGLIFYIFYKLDICHLYLITIINYYFEIFNCEDINNLINLYIFDIELLMFIRVLFSIIILNIKLNIKQKWVLLILINNLNASYLIIILKERGGALLLYLLLLRNLLISKFYLINDTNLNFIGWLDCIITLNVIISLIKL